MKAMKAVQKILTCQLLSEKHLGYKMPLSTQLQFHHAAPEIHASDMYAED